MQTSDDQAWALRFHRGMLHLTAPATFNPKRELKLDGWAWDRRFGFWSSFAAGYSQFREAIQGSGRQFVNHVAKWPEVSLEAANTVELRPYQQEAIAHWDGFKRHGLVLLPTGMGETEIALEIMRRTKAPTLVVAPVKDLMHQWHRRIAKATGYVAGVIGDRERDVRDISVTTYPPQEPLMLRRQPGQLGDPRQASVPKERTPGFVLGWERGGDAVNRLWKSGSQRVVPEGTCLGWHADDFCLGAVSQGSEQPPAGFIRSGSMGKGIGENLPDDFLNDLLFGSRC